MGKWSKWILAGWVLGLGIARAQAETVTVRLRDGSVLHGEILARTDSILTIRNSVLGEFAVRIRDLAPDSAAKSATPSTPAMANAPASAAESAAASAATDPSDQALFFLPTAFLPPARSFTFRDFELFFMTFGYSPGARTSISAGFLFPITPSAQVLTIGLKQNLWSEGKAAALSITGNLTRPISDLGQDLGLFANSNLVASKRFPGSGGGLDFGIHAAVGYLGHQSREYRYNDLGGNERVWDWQGNFDYGLGAEGALTPHAKLMFEYVSAAPFASSNDFEGGLLTIGFRLHGDRLAADIAGVRPFLKNDLTDFILWPLLVVSYRI